MAAPRSVSPYQRDSAQDCIKEHSQPFRWLQVHCVQYCTDSKPEELEYAGCSWALFFIEQAVLTRSRFISAAIHRSVERLVTG
jgi:hypothetical protein